MINFEKWIELYGDLYEINKAEETFFYNLCNEFPQHAKTLNVEAGLALLPSKLAYKYDVTVTDSHQEFIKYILSKQTNSEIQPPTFHINSNEIAKYLGKEFFNVIYCINSRLIFLQEQSLIEKLLFDAKSLLTKDGYIVFDLINFSRYDLTQNEIELPVRKTEKLSLHGKITKGADGSFLLTQLAKLPNGEAIDVVKDEKICVLTKDAIEDIAKRIGFSSITFYSDYNKTPYQKDGYRLICELVK